MITKTLKYTLILILASIPVIAILAYMATSPTPIYPPKFYQQPSQTILEKSAGANSQSIVAIVDEAELNLLVNQLITSELAINIYSTSILLQPALVNGHMTIELPYFDKRYLNISIALKPDGNDATIAKVTIGEINLPLALANAAKDIALRLSQRHQLYSVIENIHSKITDIEVEQGFLRIDYRAGFSSENQTVLATNDDVQIYLSLIKEFAANTKTLARRLPHHGHPLNEILVELFATAENRVANGEARLKEHSAIIIALSLHSSDRRILQATNWLELYQQPTARLPIGVHNRLDSGEHFISSAAAYLYAGEEVALLIGLYKEMHDTRVKEKFDLRDLAADYAGVEFAKLMTNSTATDWLAQNYQLATDDNNLLPLMTTEEVDQLKDISLLGRAVINKSTIEDIKKVIIATIKKSPLYSAQL